MMTLSASLGAAGCRQFPDTKTTTDLERQGREICRFDTCGDEQFWTDTARLHEVVEHHLQPLEAMGLGFKVDMAKLNLAKFILHNPLSAGGTKELLRENAVVGVKATLDHRLPESEEDKAMRPSTRIPFVLLAATLVGCASAGATRPASGIGREAALREAMRKLWSDHVVWTRQYIVSAVAGDPSAQAAAARLLKNQEDIGNAIAPYYGGAAGARLTDLLKQHILIAVDLVTAAKAGDNAKQADADKRWHDNAVEIATFLSGANPNWSKQALTAMLNEHLALTTQEAVARLQQRWDDDVATFDRVFAQAMTMADALSEGIAKQFPAKV